MAPLFHQTMSLLVCNRSVASGRVVWGEGDWLRPSSGLRLLASVLVILATCLVPLPTSAQQTGTDFKRQQNVPVQLRYAEAGHVAKKLATMLGPEIGVMCHIESNTVFIRGSDDGVQKAKDILKRLDTPMRIYIVSLKNVEAARVAQTLKVLVALMRLFGDDRDVSLTADDRQNEINIWATEEDARMLRTLMKEIDARPKQK